MKIKYQMCSQYPDNRYPVLWIPHLIAILTLLAGCFKMKIAICKKFLGLLLIIFHSFWLVLDIMCYSPVVNTSIALFAGLYFTLLVISGVFDGLLQYCKCWGKEEEPILDRLIRQIDVMEELEAETV
jgi:hypothetical protein